MRDKEVKKYFKKNIFLTKIQAKSRVIALFWLCKFTKISGNTSELATKWERIGNKFNRGVPRFCAVRQWKCEYKSRL